MQYDREIEPAAQFGKRMLQEIIDHDYNEDKRRDRLRLGRKGVSMHSRRCHCVKVLGNVWRGVVGMHVRMHVTRSLALTPIRLHPHMMSIHQYLGILQASRLCELSSYIWC